MRTIDLRVVLVGSLYDSNVGAVSRAMSNMSAHQLILIRPQCEITFSAQQAAASGQYALQNRRVYPSWNTFFESEPQGLRIALTARSGRLREVRDLEETLAWCSKNLPQLLETGSYPVYLILGPEDAGLAFEDLQQAHYACSIPTFGENTSLNLAQAALLTLFIFRQSVMGKIPTTQDLSATKEGQLIDTAGMPELEKTIARWLETLGFDVRENQMSAYTVLRRLMLHAVPSEKELRTLQVVLNQSIRKLTEYQAMLKVRYAEDSLGNARASIDDPRGPAAH